MSTVLTSLRRRLGLAAGALLALSLPVGAAECSRMSHDGQDYAVCTVEAAREPDLRLWLDGADGRPLHHFSALRRSLPQGERLEFAMNAGMFHADYAPVGLYKSDGDQRGQVQTRAGGGNFGLLPNGIFCSGGAQPFAVIESRAFKAAPPDCRIATQSGPMLVIDGALHPRFLPQSDSLYIRNGVGVSADGQTAWFAISERPVNFHSFARLFRDGLGARNALFLDGSISRLHAPALRRSDFGRALGPIIGLVARAE